VIALTATGAPIRAAVALGATVVRFVLLEPLACRVKGHKPITLHTPAPLTLCLRCGSRCRAR
jgi:hypothetical protein